MYLESIDKVILSEDVTLSESFLLSSLFCDKSIEPNHVFL